jgi:hypothetical protein
MASFIAGFASMILMMNLSIDWREPMAVLLSIVWIGSICGWEYYQYLNHGQKRNYWAMRWKDTLLDLTAGALPFLLLTWAGACGHYAGNVLRSYV